VGARLSSVACAAASKLRAPKPTAAVADLRDAQVLIAAEVARNYIELRGSAEALERRAPEPGYQQDTLDLTRVRLELGRGSELDVASAAARLAATEATIPPLEADEASRRIGSPCCSANAGCVDRGARAARDRAALDDDRRRLAGRVAAAPARHPCGRA
jgi:hypothetical protein